MNVVQLLGYQPTLYVCWGHGPETPGKRTPRLPDGSVIKEHQFNLPTGKKLVDLALAIGFRVVNVAQENVDTPLKARTDKANADYKQQRAKYQQVGADKVGLYISLHYNAGSGVLDSNKGGVETYHYPGSATGKKLADAIHAELIQGTPQVNRGVKSADFHVLRETAMPAALIEAGFMDNLKEALLMLSADFQLEVATETLRGVCKYFGLTYAPTKPEKPKEEAPAAKDWKQLGLEYLQDTLGVSTQWKPTDAVDMGTLGEILKRFEKRIKGE